LDDAGARWYGGGWGAACAVAGRFGAFNHYLDLMSHFTPYYLLCAIIGAVVFCVQRRWTVGLAGALCGMPAFLIVAPIYFVPVNAAEPDTQGLTVAAVNVHAANSAYEEFLAFVRDERPVVLCLSEINAGWDTVLDRLNDLYPHQVRQPQRGNFGIALLSQAPIVDSEVHLLGPNRSDLREAVPCIAARIAIGGRVVTVVAVHVYAPFTPRTTGFRDMQLADFGKLLAELEGPLIIAGDLNLTPWSPRYRALVVVAA
jgi:endonuclease/exonuclease/phosphatase (EEP) superfamily protein YafD